MLVGVPQDLVLGPALSTVYTKPLGTTGQRYGSEYHLYADDTQQYVSVDPLDKVDVSSSLENLEHWISDTQLWMTNNVLKLNED